MCLLGFNLLATIITMRAPGMTWTGFRSLSGRAGDRVPDDAGGADADRGVADGRV